MKFSNGISIGILSLLALSCNNDTTKGTKIAESATPPTTTSVDSSLQSISKAESMVGNNAPDFTLMNVDGQLLTLSEYMSNKNGAIVIFTCNHCPYSIKYEDRIIALDKKYKDLGFPVIAINPNDPKVQPEDGFDMMKKRAEEKGFTFPYLFDEGQKVYPQYGASRTPHAYVIHHINNTLKIRYVGAIDDNSDDANAVTKRFVENAVDLILNKKPVIEQFTKAIGCTIKDEKTVKK